MLSDNDFIIIRDYIASVEYYEGKMRELEQVKEVIDGISMPELKRADLTLNISKYNQIIYSQNQMSTVAMVRIVSTMYDYYKEKAQKCRDKAIAYLQSVS